MGASSSFIKKKGIYTKFDIEKLAKTTHFTSAEVQTLYDRFKTVSNFDSKDNKINITEFQHIINLPNTEFISRIFAAFDSDDSNQIEFNEFVLGLSAMSDKATIEEKAQFCFRVYDIDGNHTIDKSELKQIISFSLKSNKDIQISDELLDKIVNNTFNQVDKDSNGTISLEEFTQAAKENPSILSCVTVDLSHVFQ